MSLDEGDIDDLLCKELPEFAAAVREHRAEWPDHPMLYPLLGILFDFVVNASKITRERPMDLAQRAYGVVEKVLTSGNEGLRDCFVIQMLEPLANDPKYTFYPNLEHLMGPASRREIHAIRDWWKRQHALDAVLRQVHEKLGIEVFSSVGQQDATAAKAIANVERWKQLRREDKEWSYRTLRESWRAISGSKRAKFSITGPLNTGFTVLR